MQTKPVPARRNIENSRRYFRGLSLTGHTAQADGVVEPEAVARVASDRSSRLGRRWPLPPSACRPHILVAPGAILEDYSCNPDSASKNGYLKPMPRKTYLIGLLSLLVTLLVPLLIFAQQPTERIDLNVIHQIKTAELGGGGGGGGGGRGGRGPARQPIMETLYNLTDRYGPRLTNSPQFRAAGEWAVGQMKEWGLSNVHLEKWATAPPPAAASDAAAGGRGARAAIPSWEMTEYQGAMVSPTYMPIIGYPQAWSGSTDGKVTGDAIMVANPTTMADMDKLHGTLKGKIVLLGTGPLELDFPDKPLGTRYTDA